MDGCQPTSTLVNLILFRELLGDSPKGETDIGRLLPLLLLTQHESCGPAAATPEQYQMATWNACSSSNSLLTAIVLSSALKGGGGGETVLSGRPSKDA